MVFGSMPRKSVTNILPGGTDKYYEPLILLTVKIESLMFVYIIR